MHTTPKSYLTDAEREELRVSGMSQNSIYLSESTAARKAGDDDASWAWLARAELPGHALMFLKDKEGADFIRELGFPTKNADAMYGPGWLDRA